MVYLTGYYENFVDEKGRAILPKDLKLMMGTDLVLTRGLGDCVYVWTREAWLELQKNLSAMPMSKGRGVSLYFNAHKKDVTPDKQGRIQLPLKLREIAAIEGKAIIVGNGNRVEIWDPDRYAAMEAEMDSETIIAAMDEMGF